MVPKKRKNSLSDKIQQSSWIVKVRSWEHISEEGKKERAKYLCLRYKHGFKGRSEEKQRVGGKNQDSV